MERAAAILGDLVGLVEASRDLASVLDTRVLLRRAVHRAQMIIGADLSFAALRETPDMLVMRAVAGGRTEDLARLQIQAGAGLGGKVLIVNKPVAVADYEHDPLITRDFVDVVVRGEGIGGMSGVPIRQGGEIIGVLYVAIRSLGELGDRALTLQVELANTLGPNLGRALELNDAKQRILDAERYRIAHQLHDELGQILFQLSLTTQQTKATARQVAPDLIALLDEIEAKASLAGSYLRECLRCLSSAAPQGTFSTIAQAELENFSQKSLIPAQFILLGQPVSVPPAISDVLLGVLRESLRNVEKHAQASCLVVSLHFKPTRVSIVIQDDGQGLQPGFELAALPEGGSGWGVVGMQQRVQGLGGQLALFNNEDCGATLMASLPLGESGPS